MLVISFASMLEEAAASGRNQTGNIKNLPALLDPANIGRLKSFARVFCFLAFHAKGDPAIVDYVRSGTLADDSGPDVMVLFMLDEPAPMAVAITGSSLASWAELELGNHPAYRMVRTLFDGKPSPPLPGLVVFEDLTTDTRALYVSLAGLDAERDVRTRLRRVFTDIANISNRAKPGRMLSDLAVQLRRAGIEHHNTAQKPIREWLLQAFQVTRDHYGEIVSTISLFR